MNLAEYQQALGLHLRDPRQHARPAGLDARRTSVYSDLVMRNIEGVLATAMPVCKGLLGTRWPRLVRAFCREARSHTPLYHELSGEFLQWLMQETSPGGIQLPPWLVSLAHYEWAELAVEVMETAPVRSWADASCVSWPADAAVVANPALLALNYDWPVHRIGLDYRPRKPCPTALLVYRNEHDRVCFQEVNAPTLRLLALLTPPSSDGEDGNADVDMVQPSVLTPQDACEQVALEMGRPGDAGLIAAGLAQVLTLLQTQVLVPG